MLGRGKRGGGDRQSPDKIYRGLRTLAFDSPAKGLAFPDPEHPDDSGSVIGFPAQGGFATIVALTDNTTSMYSSTGGGTIGAGGHAKVAAAMRRLVSTVQGQLELSRKNLTLICLLRATSDFTSLALAAHAWRTSPKKASGDMLSSHRREAGRRNRLHRRERRCCDVDTCLGEVRAQGPPWTCLDESRHRRSAPKFQ